MDRGNARSSDLCLSALPLSSLSWPRPHGRTPTISPVFSNVRRSTTRLQPLRGRGLVPPDKRKTRPESEPVAAATTIASGVIHGRNHAERIVHPQTLGEPADCPIAKCRGHLLVQSPLLSRRTMHAWKTGSRGDGLALAALAATPIINQRHRLCSREDLCDWASCETWR
jgi:hypothetical protein